MSTHHLAQSFPLTSSLNISDQDSDARYSYPAHKNTSISHRGPQPPPPPPPPPQVGVQEQEQKQVYQGLGQSQSLLQQQTQQQQQHYSAQRVPRIPVGAKWGIGSSADRERAYESVPSGDPEAEVGDLAGYQGQQQAPPPPPQKRKGRSKSPKKKAMAQEDRDRTSVAMGIHAGAQEPRFHPGAHPDSAFSQIREHRRSMASLHDLHQQHQQQQQYDPHHDDSEYYPHHGQHQVQQGLGGEGYSPSTTSSARGFAGAGAPLGRAVTPDGHGPVGGVAYQLQQQQQQQYYGHGGDGGYFTQGDGNGYSNNYPPQQYQHQQQYYNNNSYNYNNNTNSNNNYSDSGPLPPPPPVHGNSRPGSTTSHHLAAGAAAAAAAGLPPPPHAPHLMSGSGNMSRHSNSSLASNSSSARRRSLPPAPGSAGIALIPADDSPYKRLSGISGSTTALGIDGQIDVNLLDENDPDDGLVTPPPPGGHHGRGILTGLRGGRNGGSNNNSGVLVGAGVAGGAAAGMLAAGGDGSASNGLLGGVNTTAPLGDSSRGITSGSGNSTAQGAAVVGVSAAEKESDWLASQKHSKKKTRKIAIIIVLILLIAIAGGVTAGVLLSKKKSSSSSNKNNSSGDNTNSSNDDSDSDPGTKSPTDSKDDDGKWKDYLDNPALHKVFHGIDYTPLDALYPECLAKPPTQSQINIDLAIMSQLTTRIRLYGTDCNQAEMVLDGIKTTGVDMKIWLGIWLDGNSTTNARSLSHMYDILDKYPQDMFEGVVVGNEVLFRQELTLDQLSTTLKEVKTNLTSLGIDLPIGTSDLGSNWTPQLASSVDVLMANIHPFFGGVPAVNASTWTMSFFENENLPKAESVGIRAMISEVGWPTGGGSLQGSVAGVEELNQMLSDWVCKRLKEGIEYYWFSAFDEPWKERYNEAGKEWEDKWGLVDAGREVKKGVVIPSCD